MSDEHDVYVSFEIGLTVTVDLDKLSDPDDRKEIKDSAYDAAYELLGEMTEIELFEELKINSMYDENGEL